MSHLVPAAPKPIKQPPQKVLTIVAPKVKLFFVLSALLLYVMVIIFIKTMTQKGNRYERMDIMVMETKQMIRQIHTMDQNLAMDMEHFDDVFADYELP